MTKSEIAHLHECVESLKQAVANNAVVIDQIKAILDSFRILAAFAKWVSGLALAAAAVVAFLKSIKGG